MSRTHATHIGLSAIALALAGNLPIHALTAPLSSGMGQPMAQAVAGAPTITSFDPTSSTTTGIWVYIAGTNLSGGTVSFNGVVSPRFDAYDTYGYALLPDGATTGPITVSNPYGSYTTNAPFVVGTVPAAPTLTSISPATGQAGTTVTLTGTGFTGATAVRFGSLPATSFVVVSATRITAVAPTGVVTGALSVTTPGGTVTGSTFTVSQVSVPTLTSISPAAGQAGTTVTLTGTGFTGATAVKFGSLPAASFVVVSAARITAVAPAGVATGAVSVTTPGGTATGSTFTVTQGTAPTITSISPNPATAYNSWITIQGTKLTGAKVSFNGVASSRVDAYDTYLYAMLPNGATSGPVTVTTTGGSASVNLTVSATPSKPTISKLSATTGKAGDTITITGKFFLSAKSVTFNGVPATFTIVSETSITAVVPIGATTGKVSVTTNGGTVASTATFTITATSAAPVISTFSPASGKAGDLLTLTGSGFTGTTAVTFGSLPAASFSVVSDTSLTAVVPAGAVTAGLSVTNAVGTTVSAGSFTVLKAPAITTFSPASGKVGDTVTLSGSGFTGTTAVTFGTLAAASFSVVSDTSLTAVVPTGAATAAITVTNPVGTATGGTFTVVKAPAITGFSPASGKAGDTVTLSGANFTGTTAVKFGTLAATSFSVVSDTSLTAVVPAGAVTAGLSVTNAVGTTVSAGSFTVLKAPAISGISPASGKVGDTVTLSGSGFTGTTAVTFGTLAAASFSMVSDTSLTVVVPTGAATAAITVTNPVGSATSGTFTVVVAPIISSFNPTTGKAGDAVTLTGTGFTGATAVAFNGTAAPFSVVSNTQITTSVPTGATTGAITVNTPAGVATSSGGYTVQNPVGTVVYEALVNGSFEAGYASGWVACPTTFNPNVWFYDTSADKALFVMGAHSGTWIGYLGGPEANERFIGQDVYIPVGATRADYSFWYLGEASTFDGQDTFAAEIVDPVSGAVLKTLVSKTGATAPSTWTQVTADLKAYAGQTIRLRFHGIRVDSTPGTANRTAWSMDDTSLTVEVASSALTPVASSFSPARGAMATTAITLKGRNFVGASEVTFGGVKATDFQVVDGQTIVVVVPALAVSGAISVKTPYGTATTSGSFQVLTADLLINGNMEMGKYGWNEATLTGKSIRIYNPADGGNWTIYPRAGKSFSLLGSSTAGSLLLGQRVSIPAGTTVADFGMWLQMENSDTASLDAGDTFTLTVENPTNSSVLRTVASFNGSNGPTGAWKNYQADLSAYAGQTVLVALRGTFNAANWTGLYADDASLLVNSSVASLQPTLTGLGATQGLETTEVQINGTNFYGVTGVSFNGVAADPSTIKVKDPNTLLVTIPVGASTGAITVKTGHGDATSSQSFSVLKVAANLLVNGNFDAGQSGWTPTNRIAVFSGGGWTQKPLNGDCYGALGSETSATKTLDQVITVPTNITSALLSFYLASETAETSAGKDTFAAQIINGTTTTSLMTADAYTGGTTWKKNTFDLSAYKGKTITLRFTATLTDTAPATGSYDWSYFYVDNASLIFDTTSTSELQPTLAGFSPSSGFPNETVVTLTGAQFYGTTAVKFGGVPATKWTVVDSKTLQATVPQGAKPGPLTVETGHGNVTSAGQFGITYYAPVITSMQPHTGPWGTPVVLSGNYLDVVSGVTVNGMAASFTINNMNQITAIVPSGATSGPVTLTNPGGSTQAGTFTVNNSLPSQDVWIDHVLVTQATQTAAQDMPLVKDRSCAVRVYLKGNVAGLKPTVRVTVMNGGATINTTDIPAPAFGSPLDVVEGMEDRIWTGILPASAIQPGMTLKVTLDPANTLAEADESNNVWPVGGVPKTFTVVDTKPMRITFVPLVATNAGTQYVGSITTATMVDFVAMFKSVWPVADALDLKIRSAYTIRGTAPDADYNYWTDVLNELQALQTADGITNRYYYGVYNSYYGTNGGTGMAYLATPVAMGIDWSMTTGGSTFSWRAGTVAHELGHSLSRPHSPCGGAGSPDAAYPYKEAIIGQLGVDVFQSGNRPRTYAPEAFNDVMAYCGYTWVSDYCYKKVMDYRTGGGDPTTTALGPIKAPEPSMMLWGTVRDGELKLNPAFVVNAVPTETPEKATYEADLLDARGASLGRVAFEPADADHDPRTRGFMAVVPLSRLNGSANVTGRGKTTERAMENVRQELAGVRISRFGEPILERKSRPVAHRGMAENQGQEAMAARLENGNVRFTWDASAHPMVMIRNAQGETIAFAENGSVELLTDSTTLEVQFSEGVTTTTRKIQVR